MGAHGHDIGNGHRLWMDDDLVMWVETAGGERVDLPRHLIIGAVTDAVIAERINQLQSVTDPAAFLGLPRRMYDTPKR